jgi:hypothetical protein
VRLLLLYGDALHFRCSELLSHDLVRGFVTQTKVALTGSADEKRKASVMIRAKRWPSRPNVVQRQYAGRLRAYFSAGATFH